MRVAILHDYLNQYGGAERVLEVMLEMFPDADLYTLLHDAERTEHSFSNNIAGTSIIDVQFVRKHHRMFIPLMPLASETFRSKKYYDLVLSSTAGYAKGFNVRGKYHISYCHSPLRYAWEVEYLKNLSFAPWPLKDFIVYPMARRLRNWDFDAAQNVNLFVANSGFIRNKIRSYYKREAEVIYPPVDREQFYPDSEMPKAGEGYYLMVGRLLYYKGFDIAIEAFNEMKLPLKIVGNGPEASKLRKLAKGSTIEFLTDISDDELRRMYSHAKAFIFPQIEDFGLVAAEAQMCGLPVLAYEVGGGGEIVEHKKTGIIFKEQSAKAIIGAVLDFESMTFDRAYISRRADMFSKKNFKAQLTDIIRSAGYRI